MKLQILPIPLMNACDLLRNDLICRRDDEKTTNKINDVSFYLFPTELA